MGYVVEEHPNTGDFFNKTYGKINYLCVALDFYSLKL